METRMAKRLSKDLQQMQTNYKDTFQVKLVNDDIKHWVVSFKGAQQTIFEGEQFQQKLNHLKFKTFYYDFQTLVQVFCRLCNKQLIYILIQCSQIKKQKPIESPEVIFVGKPPEHEHIYSNGFICLSILYDEWSAALTVSSVCLSILSMLSSAPKKAKPRNDAEFVKRSAGRGPKSFLWSFDDEKV